MNFGGELILCIIIVSKGYYGQSADLQEVERLVKFWSPLIWMSPEENYLPLSAEEFLNNVYVADENGKNIQNILNYKVTVDPQSKSYHLEPRNAFDSLQNNSKSFLFGKNPNVHSIPTYAVVTHCRPYGSKGKENVLYKSFLTSYNFHVSYWIFFPYNEGKHVCFVGKVPTPRIFNKCLGHFKTMGNHIGDWEHVSLSFAGKKVPDKLFLAVHDAGAYYRFDRERRYFKYESKVLRKGVAQVPTFPEILRTQGHHPVVFSANGSHGLWASPGERDYIKLPRLKDYTGYGIPWKTWNNIKIYHLGRSKLPSWMTYSGKWGNLRKNCILSKKLGLCEFSDGPVGILRKNQDFSC